MRTKQSNSNRWCAISDLSSGFIEPTSSRQPHQMVGTTKLGEKPIGIHHRPSEYEQGSYHAILASVHDGSSPVNYARWVYIL
ncbi:hypothetical protein VKT23_014297 [Stygiomarasmius scandens]|uniref:Uncharacterized protein n=1 Tax=Marasmiellus scandens TaxID=2682957 RepID=A0ABR1J1A2_9AGAR